MDSLAAGDKGAIIVNQTPFYAESGGQAGDAGVITVGEATFRVDDTQKKLGALHVHVGVLERGTIKLGDEATLKIDVARRRATRSNHSATHLLHEALRRVLGEHVSQKGSLVAHDRLRFDFSHPKALTQGEIATIEAQVNEVVRDNGKIIFFSTIANHYNILIQFFDFGLHAFQNHGEKVIYTSNLSGEVCWLLLLENLLQEPGHFVSCFRGLWLVDV